MITRRLRTARPLLLERTLRDLAGQVSMAVAVGDLATENDAARLRQHGAQAEQIFTGTICHLDAAMVQAVLPGFDLAGLEVLFLENVGNLVCPSSYDLGEAARAVLISTTEAAEVPNDVQHGGRGGDHQDGPCGRGGL
ncbi:hydrogenase nickel incorporation protein HypB [Deinococcus daejeonensis]|uniref:CobW/HypB/UreG nucleotide-binding domain-containing protein n=1 Tax=Deinococcus daejeonensis TaxID=1007098 RepID=A0ABQ2JGD2_9DEIO|nr:hydrogenase nickel incorporation protein HypB [Deinococcus daejeonensis]GGN46984.1 hypothetical protein GCM10010842_38070 [Deinococcus daejeonensis]